jgi:sec-independent protein translocase protein TatA
MIPGLPSIGGGEILILLAIVLLLFGAKRIPELARSLGRGTREFREGINAVGEDKDEIRNPKEKVGEKQPLEGAAPAETLRAEEQAEPTRAEQKS